MKSKRINIIQRFSFLHVSSAQAEPSEEVLVKIWVNPASDFSLSTEDQDMDTTIVTAAIKNDNSCSF